MAPGLATKRKSPARAAATDRALYFYGVTQTGGGKAVSAEGVDGVAKVEAIPCAGLVCWVSSVSRAEYANRLAENMENLEWLAAASVRHQRVVGEIAASGSILPARFGTVFLSEASLEAHVKKHKRILLAAFRRIANADEWGVKVFSVPKQPSAALHAASGTEYLRRKAAALETSRGALDPEVRSFAQALRRIAQDSASGGKVSGGQRHLEWQASFLLRRSRQKQWRAVLDRFAARWQKSRRIECSGPWPPYSFVSIDGN
jgi:hypothetical protein